MKKYFIILAIMSVLFACSKYDDSELRGRVEKLETFCNQLNTNITSLQTIVEALQNKDYVKSVTPIYETNKVIGYTINFEKSGVITIYHGKDGLAGSTPSIGVRQDTDGIYYWTIDGKWMTNEDGGRIPSTGENGPEGTPGITPKFKIENSYWCVSYDNGANWEQLGQATGDKGDSVFKDVIIKEDNIQFILSDGTSFIVPRIMGNEITVNVENILGNKAEFKGTISMPILGENDYSVGIIYSKNGLLPIDESVMLPITSVEDEIKFNITASNLEYATQYYYSYYIFKDGRYDIGSAKSFTTSLYKCEVKIPGTLQELISDEIKNKITGLEISGSINGTDIKFIRSLGEQDICKLNTLDLTNANIVEGGEPYARDLYTKNDVIGKFMFSSLRIKNIYIPSSVNLIEEFSFFDSMVNYVKLNFNVTKIGESAFLYCHNLKSIKIPGNIKEIDRQAFVGCNNLSEVELEEGVEIIRTIAFGDCNYRTINIPNSVILIEEGAFSGATNNDIVSYTGKFTTSDNKCIIFDNILINYAIGCSSTYYRVPYFVTKIGHHSFSRADKLKEIQLSSTVKTIGSYAFQFCSNIESVVLNEGLTSIEDEVFRECRKLSNITIPESVESIGEKAFYNLYLEPYN